MLASAASFPASVAMYFAMAPSVFKLPSPGVDALRGFLDVGAGRFQSRHVGTISLWV